ncbi:very short patch repair endonuclease [Mycolicibacterium hodleri]|uniref:Very short patch repair endonuclease n=1 Tax=Mycolicibacterium hodleri TaxID=49897 RepID=A0A502EDW9_9MYCO|nr:very short patch repair endonuclease [Mycolicibacterium hodleri]TPG34660.1 very short patch repair endonuclease [Mycolicibacterium hodleri]
MTSRAQPHRAPKPLSEAVRRQMSAMPTSDTGAEMALRRELHGRGMRFRVQVRTLPGRPDIAFTRARIAVFVDGCFWHRCPIHGTAPKNNADWWAAKLDANVARDARKDASLEELSWLAVHVWEHDDPVIAADAIEHLWQSRLTDAAAGQAEDVGHM